MDIYLYLLPVFQLPVNCVINVIQLYLLHLLGGNYIDCSSVQNDQYMYIDIIFQQLGCFFFKFFPSSNSVLTM